jgi:hypothetical protein
MTCFRGLRRRSALRVTLALSLVLSALAAISVFPAVAQGDLQIPQASLRLWPEYDDPGVLVIFAGSFADTAAFPQKVAFPVTTGARNIQATVNDAAEGLLTQQWQMEGNKVTYTLPQPGFHLEYYVDRPPSGNLREIVHTFEAPYPIESLEIAVQQPARATDFSVTPQPSSVITGSDGLTYHIIRYTKTDSGVTAPQLAVTSATPVAGASESPGAQPKPATPTNWLPFALIGAGLLALIGIGVYWFLSHRRAPPKSVRRPTVTSASSQPAPRPAPAAAATFCTQCGRAFRPEERFCAACGTPRKR